METQSTYYPPDFSSEELRDAPEATFEAMPADGVLPHGFFATTNLPTWVKLGDSWLRPKNPRMDCVIFREGDELRVCEPRDLKAGDLVAMGAAENGRKGILVHGNAFTRKEKDGGDAFQFMSTEVSRERPVDYELLAKLLVEERLRSGYITWVIGPALVHARSREELIWFIKHGYVSVMLGGNAIAVHDIEASLFGTALGMSATGEAVKHGHAMHLKAINQINAVGSIEQAIRDEMITGGVMHALVTHDVPYVLAGSIRDDGPLPGVITDAVEAQRAMRVHAQKTTFALFLATVLHSIAVGNMLPAFVDGGGDDLRPLHTICVDQTEFVVNKLRDRGTHQAHAVVTNVQDFIHILRGYVEKWEQASG
ncbi:MAG: hypothetical protein IH877_02160 [Gemmatimonadetes bacterium]|nr:hypothetical protein [Gemmatimonadota bacterium]